MNIGIYRDGYYCMWCESYYEKAPSDNICTNCGHEELEKVNLNVHSKHNVAIIKIKTKEILENMRNGVIWFQPAEVYRNYKGKGETAIADPDDGKSLGNFYDSRTYRYLCFYSLSVDYNNKIIEKPSKELENFGDYFSVIDIRGLEKELQKYFNSKKIQMESKFIKYCIKDYYSTYNPTFKKSEYMYQNEYRIIISSTDFLSLNREEPYVTDKHELKVQKYFSDPIHINELMNSSSINDININFRDI